MLGNFNRISCVIMVVLIIGVAFFSQQPSARGISKSMFSASLNQVKSCWEAVSGWFTSSSAKKSNGGVSGGGGVKNEQNNNENIFSKNKIYFSRPQNFFCEINTDIQTT